MEWWSNGVMGYCRSGPEHPNTRTPEHRNTYPASHIAMRHLVARTSELPPGARKIVEVAGRSIGIFNVHGRYVAVLNVCPHEQAPVCRGRVGGTTLPSGPGEYCYRRQARSRIRARPVSDQGLAGLARPRPQDKPVSDDPGRRL